MRFVRQNALLPERKGYVKSNKIAKLQRRLSEQMGSDNGNRAELGVVNRRKGRPVNEITDQRDIYPSLSE